MADQALASLTAASALTGTELIYIDQSSADRKATATQLKTFTDTGLAPLASPTFTGTPAAPTATGGTNTTQVATTAFVAAAVTAGAGVPTTRTVTAGAGLTGGGALSSDITLNAIAGTGITVNADDVALTVPVAVINGGTGAITAPAARTSLGLGNVDNTSDASKPVSTATQTALDLKANLASPTFTGTPAAPTATAGTNTTQLATTAFVAAAVTGGSIADGDKTDITVSSSGTVWTIDPGAVTYAKIQNVSATSRFLGRVTAAAGVVEELTAANAKTILGITSGDVSGLAAIATSGSANDLTAGTVAAARMPAYTGDVTSSVGAVANTIANDAVTYAKIQNVSATDKVLGRSTAGAGDVEEITCTSFARTLLDDTTQAIAQATLGVVPGTNVQAQDAELAAIAGLTSAADRLPYFTGSGTASLATFTTFGRSLVDDADAVAGRQTLVGSINAQSGTTYTFVLTDAEKLCTFSNAGATTVTIPTNASVAFPIGTQIDVAQVGAGKVTFAGTPTINSQASNKALAAQYAGATLRKTATDTWLLVGNLIA